MHICTCLLHKRPRYTIYLEKLLYHASQYSKVIQYKEYVKNIHHHKQLKRKIESLFHRLEMYIM